MTDLNVRSIRRVIRFSRSRDDSQQIICSAIRQLRPIEFYYHGGYRTVEPFALGVVLTNSQITCRCSATRPAALATFWK